MGENLAADIYHAAVVISQGGIVAFPTETYYGLAVDPFNATAVERLFRLKKRPSAKPLLTLISEKSQLSKLTPGVPSQYEILMDCFWPGPLTLIFEALSSLSPFVCGHTQTIGARISSHAFATALVAKTGQPVTATSANVSGHPPAVSAAEVARAFGSGLDYVLDGGQTPGGKGSTLIGVSQGKAILIREGVISFSEITQRLHK